MCGICCLHLAKDLCWDRSLWRREVTKRVPERRRQVILVVRCRRRGLGLLRG